MASEIIDNNIGTIIVDMAISVPRLIAALLACSIRTQSISEQVNIEVSTLEGLKQLSLYVRSQSRPLKLVSWASMPPDRPWQIMLKFLPIFLFFYSTDILSPFFF